MEFKKRKIAQLEFQKEHLEKQIKQARDQMDRSVVLSCVDDTNPIAQFPDVILNLLNEFDGNKVCSRCRHLFPCEMECLSCVANKVEYLQLKGTVHVKAATLHFSDSRDVAVWNYAAQLFTTEQFLHLNHFLLATREPYAIWIGKDTIYNNEVYLTVKLISDRNRMDDFCVFAELNQNCYRFNLSSEDEIHGTNYLTI
jgi:hypothetical protein